MLAADGARSRMPGTPPMQIDMTTNAAPVARQLSSPRPDLIRAVTVPLPSRQDMATSAGTTSNASFHVPMISRTEAIVMLVGASCMLSIAMGMRQSFGLFQTPVVRELGIATADFALAIAIQNLTWGLAGPFAGAMIDRYGT